MPLSVHSGPPVGQGRGFAQLCPNHRQFFCCCSDCRQRHAPKPQRRGLGAFSVRCPKLKKSFGFMPERDLRTKDVANAAAVLLDAVRNAEGRKLTTVSTPHGPVDVVLDNAGADLVLHGRDATVHVRRDGGADPDGRS